MSLRTILPLLLVALGTGYLAGLLYGLRTVDRVDATGPGDGATARAELVRVREADRTLGDDGLAARRQAFLARWPDSWLRTHWEGRGR